MTQEEYQLLVDRKAEAEKAYHSLVTGTAARVFVDQNGERVEFVAANANRLYAYIQKLAAQLAAANTATQPPSGPLGIII